MATASSLMETINWKWSSFTLAGACSSAAIPKSNLQLSLAHSCNTTSKSFDQKLTKFGFKSSGSQLQHTRCLPSLTSEFSRGNGVRNCKSRFLVADPSISIAQRRELTRYVATTLRKPRLLTFAELESCLFFEPEPNTIYWWKLPGGRRHPALFVFTEEWLHEHDLLEEFMHIQK